MSAQALLFAFGLLALVAGAESLVRGASRLALSFGISPLVIGLTVVAFGTSAPELAVSVGAVLDDRSALAVGNAVGSNVFNVLFILGLAAVITPLSVHVQVIRQEIPVMLGAALLVLLMAQDGVIGRFDSVLLSGGLVAYTVFLIKQSRAEQQDADAAASRQREDAAATPSRIKSLLMLLAGLALLVLGAQWMVGAAVHFARVFGVSEVVIGLTVVAVGTSLPEVAASIAAALKGERDIAVGNVVGSCVFNLLGVVGLAGLVSAADGLPIPAAVLHFDLWVMLGAFAACLPIFITGREVARWEGGLFLAYYGAYTAYLVLKSQDHAVLPAYSQWMLGFVLPLTVVTIFVMLIRPARR